ncbi:unnamed protein product [Brassica oleracea]
MADPSPPTSLIDSRSGFCKANSTFYTKRNPLGLPANPSLDVTTFISSQPHRGTTAFIDAATGHSLSFSDLWRAVDRVAECLHHDVGIRRGDVVLILSPNSIYIPIVCLSVMSLGAVVTTANTLNTAGEISRQIADSNPTLAFTTVQLASKLPVGISIVLTEEERVEPTRGVVGAVSEMMKKEPRGQRVRDRVHQDDTAVMLYSSGTTGPSKGVLSSHGNLTAYVARMLTETSVHGTFICTVPMFHTYGLLTFAMASVAIGSTVVILKRFELNDMMAAVEKYKATTLLLVPPVLVTMVNEADSIKAKYDLSSLKTVRCGGAPLSKEVTEGFLEKYPTVNIFQAYALTESNGGGAFIDTVEDSRRFGTSGPLTSDVEARIVDPHTGRFLGINQTGELWLKGPTIAKGYFKNQEATNETINAEGWLKTGDLCYIDEDGFVFAVDRLKELIKYKGYQVPPAELEALLITHPDILDAAVIPFPDKEAGQYPMAYVTRKVESNLSEKQVIEFISKQVYSVITIYFVVVIIKSWLYLKGKYSDEAWLQSEKVSVKDALKVLVLDPLRASLGAKSDSSSFHIRLTYSQASDEAQGLSETKHERKKRKTDEENGSNCMSENPFKKVSEPCILSVHCNKMPIFFGGRYFKYSRNVSQSRWIIDDERMGEASVEEIIGGSILPACLGDSYKFHAAGREDIDVRMLGSGRPFLIEVQNSRKCPSQQSLTEIEEKINNSEKKLVGVKDLKFIGSECWAMMREGEAEKQKQYAALVWISRPLEEEDCNSVSSMKELKILQKTPIRVLHRRSQLERERTIHWMKVEKIKGNAHYFLLHLCTQAGTYIKEFVHGDLGRTTPSMGSILGCRAEIIQLDVTDVKMGDS